MVIKICTMKYTVLMFVMLFAVLSIQAQEVNREFEDERTGSKVLIGECNREGLQSNEEFSAFYVRNYREYSPDEKVLKKLKRKIRGENISIQIVLGSWCHDSQVWVPRFYKIMDDLPIDENKINLIGVDTRKKAITMNIDDLNIERVPTFIVYNEEGQEIGRIIESPYETLEEDLLNIVKQL